MTLSNRTGSREAEVAAEEAAAGEPPAAAAELRVSGAQEAEDLQAEAHPAP